MTILTHPHQLLTTRLEPLEEITDRVRQDASSMLLLCAAKEGLGLSANQVGLTYRMFVIPSLARPVCINPEIVSYGKTQIKSLEGCLSFPNYQNVALRRTAINVRYYTLDGELVETQLQNMPAIIFQHELDHLNGILLSHKKVIDR